MAISDRAGVNLESHLPAISQPKSARQTADPRNDMFRAEIRQSANGPTLKLEGRLVGDWAEQAKTIVTQDLLSNGLIVDLTDVTYVDSAGEQVLSWLSSIGATFIANGIYATGVCEQLRLMPKESAHSSKEKALKRRARGGLPVSPTEVAPAQDG